MKKITKKELENIIAQQSKLGNLYNQIGSIELNKSLKLDELKQLHKDVDSLKKKLEKKYGSVNINLEDGAITPIEEPKLEQADV
jgi:hypothetical protein|tara:strand:- start:77 stop:328 length:252 start_codon:yes stop_codon:yes gene_type:complete